MKKICCLLIVWLMVLQQLHTQAPDKAQLERLKKMAERMRGMTPAQARRNVDSILKVVKKLQNTSDSVITDVSGQVTRNMPNNQHAKALLRPPKYDTSYTSVSFSYRYSENGPGYSKNATINGGSDHAPILTNGNGRTVQVRSENDLFIPTLSKLVAGRMVRQVYADGYGSLVGSGTYAASSKSEGQSMIETGGQLSDTMGLMFSFIYDSLENMTTVGLGGGVKTRGSITTNGETEHFIKVEMVGGGGVTKLSAARIMGADHIEDDPDMPPINVSKTSEGFHISYTKTKEDGDYRLRESFNAFVGIPKLEYEALIKPFERGGFSYRKWLPKGAKPDNSDDTKGDDSLRFYIVVRDKNDTTKLFHGNYTINWSLQNVTRYPGICNNYPEYSETPNTDADLKFDSLMVDDNYYDASLQTDSTAVTKDGKGADALLHVLCMDYAAYGRIKAVVTLDNGMVLRAISPDTKKAYVSIPLDNNNNKIADAWEKQETVYEKNYPPNWDEDNLPKDLGDHDGDGYTLLLEEYRGFSAKQEHFRSSANTKDLMVLDMIEDRAKDGIALFKDQTRVLVHDDFTLKEFGRPTQNFASEGMDHDKCLNYNYTPETHSVDQHGIALVKSLERKGYAEAVTKIDTAGIGTPKDYKYLEITVDFDPGPDGFNVVHGNITNAGTFDVDARGKAKIVSDSYAHTVAHEMLHCCNVKHHGDIDFGRAVLIAGKYLLAANKFPKVKISPDLMYLVRDGTTIFLAGDDGRASWESGARISADQFGADGIDVFVASQGGQHSGVEDCIMRYRAADAFLSKDNKFYLVSRPAGYMAELAGIILCNSKAGTGVNKQGRDPRPRCGDATEGNCRHQFCINDKYHQQK